jgi:hypothetical protein
MTDEELNRIEGIFASPASASLPRELGLQLCAEVRRLRAGYTLGRPVAAPLNLPATTSVTVDGQEDKPKKKGGK